ncbi:MAG: flavodoxin [Candidatus Komeilibacteria bacterium CG_4_10_14_0_2_um_filter_37_10]|uniref:Flavodoxin n=1 Tax=Candidatus Komeilibacteria bacterium CG_4_10_14_0_2_um_filter_37_10 TaxID=1974470 RepID=A0A2M7VET9_9BACT|nr:MAG: flavodoxin [Candidatus Komeilibacteria bacterium CG_4_10_14_0_2_um_filter_37_10]
MKKLIVYYSLSGNVQAMAEAMADAIGADILVLKPQEEIKATGLMKYFWGGRQVVMGVKPELRDWLIDPRDYDFIIIGTPVWAYTFAPPLSTFFSLVKLQNKKVAVFCCHGGGKRNTLDKMKEQLKDNIIVGKIDFLEPQKHDLIAEKKRAAQWATMLVNKLSE